MIRKILISALLVVVATTASAAGGIKLVQFGLKAGITSESVSLLGPTYGNNNNYALATDPRTGFQIGIVSRINLLALHIQPELLYSMNSYRLIAHSSDGVLSRSIVKVNSFDVPILVGLKFFMFRINAGPVLNLATNSHVTKSDAPAHSVIMTKPAISYALGVGVDLGKFNFDVRYNGQFARPEQNIQIGSEQSKIFNTKLRTWAFSVGYLF